MQYYPLLSFLSIFAPRAEAEMTFQFFKGQGRRCDSCGRRGAIALLCLAATVATSGPAKKNSPFPRSPPVGALLPASSSLPPLGGMQSREERRLISELPTPPPWDASSGAQNDIGKKVIYIMRHGEKPLSYCPRVIRLLRNATACLNARGRARARNLRRVFGWTPERPFRTPDALFAGKYGVNADCVDRDGYRTVSTLVPLARELGLPIERSYGWTSEICAPEDRGNCRGEFSVPLADIATTSMTRPIHVP